MHYKYRYILTVGFLLCFYLSNQLYIKYIIKINCMEFKLKRCFTEFNFKKIIYEYFVIQKCIRVFDASTVLICACMRTRGSSPCNMCVCVCMLITKGVYVRVRVFVCMYTYALFWWALSALCSVCTESQLHLLSLI